MQKQGYSLIGPRGIFLKCFLKKLRYLLDRMAAIALLPHKAAEAIQCDPEVRSFQSRQQMFHQQTMAKFGFEQNNIAVAGGFGLNDCNWDQIEKIRGRLFHNFMAAACL